MTRAQRFTLVGTRPTDEPGWFDAFDAIIELESGDLVCFGARSPEALNAPSRPHEEDQPWGEYVPLPVTLDFATVHHYDFNAPMWLGPEPRPCVVWTNAVALNVVGVGTLLRYANRTETGGILGGADGAGLPSPAEVGLAVPEHPTWHEVPTNLDTPSSG